MSTRQPVPLPRIWLMTDERLGNALWDVLRRLPPGSGVVFRHYHAGANRLAIWHRLRRESRRRRLILLSAGRPLPGCDGVHNGQARGRLSTRSVHDAAERRMAIRRRADAVFVSPVYATRSHPGSRTLGVRGLARLAVGLPMPAIALGGMSHRRFLQVARMAHGWAAIDAWAGKRGPGAGKLRARRPGDQKRNAVPT